VSKIQTSIEKAIETSKQSGPAKAKKGKKAPISGRPSVQRSANDAAASGIFRSFQSAVADRDVMERNRLVTEIEDRGAIAAYKIMRTRVLHRMRSNNWQTLVVTSAGAGEGKTLTATNLALSISRDVNQSVLLIDLDLQRSRVAECLGLGDTVQKGISDFLTGEAEITDIIYGLQGLPRLSVIPNRRRTEDSSDLLAGPRMFELIQWIREQSDRTIVIYDMPPVLAGDDVLAFIPYADALLLVASQGKTDRASLEKAMQLVAEYNVLGAVLNRCSETNSDSAYGYY
jgi:capsular exopolysaccharide synthesis family protein